MIAPAYQYTALIIRWVDGDTVWLNVDLGFRVMHKSPFRLHGVNTPERGEPGWAAATLYCNEVAPVGTEVNIETYKNPDKYGRWLVDIYIPGIPVPGTLNASLIKTGHAVPYMV